MLQRDYILRMTQMLADALKRILLLKEEKKFEDAKKEIENEGKSIVGLDMKMISMFDLDDIMMLMNTTEYSAGRFIISAELLMQYGEIFEIESNDEKASALYAKSLHLFIEAVLSRQLPELEMYYEKIELLLQKLEDKGTAPHSATRLRLIDHYEAAGNFAKAEDVIFELKDEEYPGIEEIAGSYYKRLLLKPDQELIAGNLSREEVLQGIKEIQG